MLLLSSEIWKTAGAVIVVNLAKGPAPGTGVAAPGPSDPYAAMELFRQKIQRQEDLMYGVALFFEGICLLYAGQEAVIETFRRQFRNMIQTGTDTAHRAATLLTQVEQDPSKVAMLDQFDFAPCHGHAEPAKMMQRAQILFNVYRRLYPDRSRSEPFTEDETLRLMEEAGMDLRKLG